MPKSESNIKSSSANNTRPNFEKSLTELEKIVARMEQGEQNLDDMLKDFERGMILSAECQQSLAQAQQKVEKLVEKHAICQLEPMNNNRSSEQEY